MSEVRPKEVTTPFRAAMAGIAYTFRTQRHMRFHLYTVLVVILAGVYMNLGLRELMVLLLMISLVLIAEMFNSAIEATVDLVQPSYHPLAKFAKDISAGAVLITTIIALVIAALLILGEGHWEQIKTNLTSESVGTPYAWRIVLGMLMLIIIVIIGKGLGKRGQVLRGGLVSGHSAFAFFFAMAAVFISDNAVVSGIAILLAAIVAQSRWEAKIHSVVEISLGAGVGVVLGLVLFGLLPK
jgi:diacylglycerol kinase (ATP)